MLDVLIKNANIIDGTGKPAYKGSIGISGGKLVRADGSEEATAVIDASGKYVSPGWIDAHSHGDLILGSEDAHLFKTTQGVTTELTGQCGLSMAPVMPENLAAVQNMLSMGTTWFPDDMKNWSSFARFLHAHHQSFPRHAGIGLTEEFPAPRMSKDLTVSPEIVSGDLDTAREHKAHRMDLGPCEKDSVAFFIFFFYCGETL